MWNRSDFETASWQHTDKDQKKEKIKDEKMGRLSWEGRVNKPAHKYAHKPGDN